MRNLTQDSVISDSSQTFLCVARTHTYRLVHLQEGNLGSRHGEPKLQLLHDETNIDIMQNSKHPYC